MAANKLLALVLLLTAVATAQTTPNLNLAKPVVGSPGWGPILNSNWDKVDAAVILKAPLNSPAFTGIPTAPTAGNGTNTTQIATTAFVLANPGTFTQAGTGAVARTFTSKLQDAVSVRDFGAAGTGGDDTPFFTLAIAASKAVYVPCGTYNVTGLALTPGLTITGPATHWDSTNTNSCVILQSSTGDILTAGAANLKDVSVENLTLKSNAGGGHTVNLNAATTQIAQISFKNVNFVQVNVTKACVLYDVAAGAVYEVYIEHYYFAAEDTTRTVPCVKFRALTVNTIDMTHGVITSANSATGTYQIWIEGTNSGAPVYQVRIIDLVSEVPGGGGINCLGCNGALIENAMSYDLGVLPAHPFINIDTSPAGTLARNNLILASFSRVGSASFPDVNLVDSGGTEVIQTSNFAFVNTSSFILNIASTITTLTPSYAVTTITSLGMTAGLTVTAGGAAGTGQYIINGATSGAVVLTANDAAGTPTDIFPTISGTVCVSGNPCTATKFSLTNLWQSATAPTISSGFGGSPSVTANNGTAAFRINVGTGGSATSGVIGMPTATTGWNCSVNDLTAAAAHVAYNTRQTASATTTVTVENQTTSTGAAIAWAASDILALNCSAF